jgi:enoyl-CoA hydratase/carnithine racemase
VRMNRPKDLNCMDTTAQWDMHMVWEWLDEEPNLTIAILTGTGRAFSAGADLKGIISTNTFNLKANIR